MSRALPTPKTVLDPIFKPPTGSEENFTSTYPAPDRTPQNTDPAVPYSGGVETGTVNESEFYIATPEGVVIIDQKLRRAPGGQQVVDIVVQCEDVLGALEYEVQIAKV